MMIFVNTIVSLLVETKYFMTMFAVLLVIGCIFLFYRLFSRRSD